MKKNLLYLLALVCSLTFFAACSSDDDDSDNKDNGNPPEEEAVITAPDVVGTYWGNLDISMIPDGYGQEIGLGDVHFHRRWNREVYHPLAGQQYGGED